MYGPPSDPRDRSPFDRLSWRSVLAAYAIGAAVPPMLWVVSHPAAGVVVLTVVVVLIVGARRAVRVARCFYDCRGFTFDLGGRVRITVTRSRIDD